MIDKFPVIRPPMECVVVVAFADKSYSIQQKFAN